ncbi:MAG: hypothetical protein Q7S92_04055 [Candidatus Diapherotrites archaeon]|nr:hypothetical protein [Candidatus Diapherotrites archaeon]
MNPFKLRTKEEETPEPVRKWELKTTQQSLIEKHWKDSVPVYQNKEMRQAIMAFEELNHRQQNEILDQMFSYTDEKGNSWIPSQKMLSGRREYFETKIQRIPKARLAVLAMQINQFAKNGKL